MSRTSLLSHHAALSVTLALLASLLAAPAPARGDGSDAPPAQIMELPGLGGFDIVAFAKGEEPGCFVLQAPSQDLALVAFQPDAGPTKPWHAAIRLTKPESFSLSGLVPRLDGRILGDPGLAECVLVSSRSKEKVPLSKFPAEMKAALAGFDEGTGSLELQEGVNLYAAFGNAEGGLLGLIQGIREAGEVTRVIASIDAGSVDKLLREAGLPAAKAPKKPSPSQCSIKVTLPETTPFPFSATGDKDIVHMVNRGTQLSVTETSKPSGGTSKATWDVSGTQRISLWIAGKQVDLDSTLTVKATDTDLELTRSGKATINWKDAFGVPGLEVKSVTLQGKLTTGGAKDAEKPTGRARSDANADLNPPVTEGRARSDANADLHPEKDADKTAKDSAKDPVVDLGIGLVIELPKAGELTTKLGVRVGTKGVTDLDLSLSGTDGGLDFSALPGLKALPGIEQFRLSEATLGIDRIAKDVYISAAVAWPSKNAVGRAALATFSPKGKNKKAFVMFLKAENLSLGTFFEALPAPLGDIALDRGMIAISSEDFDGLEPATMAAPVKEMVTSITGTVDRKIPLFKGLSLFVALEPDKLGSEARQLLEKLGVNQPMVLAGSVGGLVGGEPSIALYADLPSLPIPKTGPLSIFKAAASKAAGKDVGPDVELQSAGARLFLTAQAGASNNMQLGVEGRFGMRLGDDELVFAGNIFMQLSAVSQAVAVSGRMDGEWDAPLGLEGITFRDVVIGAGYDTTSAVTVALNGEAEIGKLAYQLSGVIALQPTPAAGVPVPKMIGLKFEGSELSQLTQYQLMGTFVKAAATGVISHAIPDGKIKDTVRELAKKDLVSEVEKVFPLPLLKFKDVGVYLATPGATFPGVDLDGMGIGVHGKLLFMNKELGSVHNFLSLQDGLQIHETVGDVELGLLSLKGTLLDVRVPMPGLLKADDEKAHFAIKGALGIGCSLLNGDLEILLSRDEAGFITNLQIADYECRIDAMVDLSDFPDFGAKGDFAKKLVEDVLKLVQGAVEDAAKEGKKKIDNGIAEAKDRREERAAARELAVEAVKAEVRAQAEAKLNQVRGGISALAKKAADTKLLEPVKPVIDAAANAANALGVAKDGAVEGIAALKNKLDEIAGKLSKLPDALGKEVKGAVNDARSKLDGAVAIAGSMVQKVKDSKVVQAADKELQQAQDAVTNFTDGVKDTLDLVAAHLSELKPDLTIEKVGFDSDLSALCKGTLPKLNVWGTFHGQPFELRGVLELAKPRDLARKNKKNVEIVVQQLLALLDPEAAREFVQGLVK